MNALKGALDLKADGGAQVTVLNLGTNPSKGLLLKSLAAFVDTSKARLEEAGRVP